MPEAEPVGRDRYEKGEKVGEGTFGVVYRAVDKLTKADVAIKKIRATSSSDGVDWTALREIKLLQELHHPNIVSLMDVFVHNGSISLVFEFCTTDLEDLVRNQGIVFTPADIKSYMQMMLKGLDVCHKAWVLHRDLKPSNYLVGTDHQIKLADFGLARIYGSPNRAFSHQVVTLFYRAPELLFGASEYGPGVDMWAIGCIFAELLLRTPLFPGKSEIDQLGKIFHALGTPTETEWPGMTTLKSYIAFHQKPPTPLRQIFSAASDDALELLQQFLHFNPNKRISAEDALNHPYFVTHPPAPTPPEKLVQKPLEVSNAHENGKKKLPTNENLSPNIELTLPLRKQLRFAQ